MTSSHLNRLTVAQLRVLLVLADGAEHYGLDLRREADLPSGTLYPILKRLRTEGLVSWRQEEGDPRTLRRARRTYYRLEPAGAAVLDAVKALWRG